MRRIRLTESQLHKVIKEATKRILREFTYSFGHGDRSEYKNIQYCLEDAENAFRTLLDKIKKYTLGRYNGESPSEMGELVKNALTEINKAQNSVMYMLSKKVSSQIAINLVKNLGKNLYGTIITLRNILPFIEKNGDSEIFYYAERTVINLKKISNNDGISIEDTDPFFGNMGKHQKGKGFEFANMGYERELMNDDGFYYD
jgi:hypothetical protein